MAKVVAPMYAGRKKSGLSTKSGLSHPCMPA